MLDSFHNSFQIVYNLVNLIDPFIGIATFLLALFLKKEVNRTIERIEFRKDYEQWSGEAAGFINLLNSDIYNEQAIKLQLHDYLAKLKYNYTFFTFSTKRTIKKLEHIQLNKNDLNSVLQFQELLRKLEAKLLKEGKIS